MLIASGDQPGGVYSKSYDLQPKSTEPEGDLQQTGGFLRSGGKTERCRPRTERQGFPLPRALIERLLQSLCMDGLEQGGEIQGLLEGSPGPTVCGLL